MEALDYVNTVNMYGRNLRIHGVNLSVGYEFDAEWFACGQSPLCRSRPAGPDRVVVVVAAGNTGYGQIRAKERPTPPPGSTSPSTTPATPTARSRSARRTATSRTPTASRTSPRRARPATDATSPISSRPASGSSRARPAPTRTPKPATTTCTRSTSSDPARAWPRPTSPARSPRSCRSAPSTSGSPSRSRTSWSVPPPTSAQFVLPGKRPTGSHARHPGRMTSVGRHV